MLRLFSFFEEGSQLAAPACFGGQFLAKIGPNIDSRAFTGTSHRVEPESAAAQPAELATSSMRSLPVAQLMRGKAGPNVM
jgi:hypothetical protein